MQSSICRRTIVLRNNCLVQIQHRKFTGFQNNKEIAIQRRFFEELGKKLNIKSLEDWYNLTYKDLVKYGGGTILRQYANSPIRTLKTIYPDHNWEEWKFTQVPANFWKDMNNQRSFFESLAKKLNIKGQEDWYRVSFQDISENGGLGLLSQHYGSSPSKAIMSVFPEYNWQPWSFEKVHRHYWDESSNIQELMKWLTETLQIKHLDDWYNVSLSQLYHLGAKTAIERNGGLFQLLSKLYPEHKWDSEKLNLSGKTQQFLKNKKNSPTTY